MPSEFKFKIFGRASVFLSISLKKKKKIVSFVCLALFGLQVGKQFFLFSFSANLSVSIAELRFRWRWLPQFPCVIFSFAHNFLFFDSKIKNYFTKFSIFLFTFLQLFVSKKAGMVAKVAY